MVSSESLDERAAWIVLAAVPGVGEATFAQLVAAHGGAAAVLALAAADRLPRLAGLPARTHRAIRDAARGPERLDARLDELDLWTVTPLDADYPAALLELESPPAVLFGWGSRSALAEPHSVAIVGTRRPSLAGRATAGAIAAVVVDCGLVIVSGLAIGIDGATHAAVVGRGGCTVGVLGGGHDQPGPRAHRDLVREIVASGGAVISELPPDSRPSKGSFPRRNRIIAALAETTIVVEAPARSGALITARHALELGRAVFVVPGRPGDPLTAGSLALLRETPARPYVGLDELIADLELDLASTVTLETGAPSLGRSAALRLLSGAERQVAEALCRRPGGADGLVQATELPPAVVAGALTLLQLRGWIQTVGPAYLPAGPLLRPDGRSVAEGLLGAGGAGRYTAAR